MLGCRKAATGSSVAPLEPLGAPSWLVPLAAGAARARVSVPLGAQRPLPLAIALHGHLDRPEWACGSYRAVSQNRGFVLCPEGVALGAAFTPAPRDAARQHLKALLPELKHRFGAHLASGSVVLAGIGAAVPDALALALEEPAFFKYLVLVDGSLRSLDAPAIVRLVSGGAKRALVVCSASACDADVEQRVLMLRRSNLDVRLITPDRGHGLDAEIVARLAREWPWLVAGDTRWQ